MNYHIMTPGQGWKLHSHSGSVCEYGHAIPQHSCRFRSITDEEVYALSRVGALKSPITATSNPHISTTASRMEPDLATQKRTRGILRGADTHVFSCWNAEDLGKSEYERSTEPKCITGDGVAWLPSVAYR